MKKVIKIGLKLLLSTVLGSFVPLLGSVGELIATANQAEIHVFGDSHAFASFGPITDCKVNWLGPYTMHRFGQEKLSLLNIKNYGVKENDTVIFVFGEIDIRCHIKKVAKRLGEKRSRIIDRLAKSYLAAIQENRQLFKTIHPVIFAVLPPTDQIHNPNFPIDGSLKERVHMTKRLNHILTTLAQKQGIALLNVYDDYATTEGFLNPHLSDGNVHINGQDPTILYPLKKQLIQLLTKIYAN